MGIDWATPVAPYGDTWRTHRRLLHAHLNRDVATKYQPTQIASARKFAKEILTARQEVGMVSHVALENFGRMMIQMVYGIDSEEAAREHLSLAEFLLEAFSVAFTPGHFLVDFLTFCENCCVRFLLA
jgi:cytochrome P450